MNPWLSFVLGLGLWILGYYGGRKDAGRIGRDKRGRFTK
jgi:hypothetical protein